MNSAKTKEEIKRSEYMMMIPEKEKRRARRKIREVDIDIASVRKGKKSIVSSKTQRWGGGKNSGSTYRLRSGIAESTVMTRKLLDPRNAEKRKHAREKTHTDMYIYAEEEEQEV